MTPDFDDAASAPRTVGITLDGAALARAEGFAAARGTTVEALVERHVRDLGDGVTSVRLPAGSAVPFLRMFHHAGRDTTVTYLADGAWDEFEQPMPAHFHAWARSHPGVVIDGGASTGFYALLAAAAGPETVVLAFEPDPVVHALLRANIDANGLGHRITARLAALSRTPGRAPLYVPTQDHGVIETSSSLNPEFKARFSDVVDVETTTVDEAADAVGPDRRVSLVKLDLAGHEAAALEGAERTVSRDRPAIFAEMLDRADYGTLTRFVRRHNYIDVPLRSAGALRPQAAVTFEGDAVNHALVPSESLPAFLLGVRAGTWA